MIEPPRIEPTEKPLAEMVVPERLALRFEGFGPEAFAVLERLRAEPHITRYRAEKAALARHVQAPFKRYRDDLVVNWVLPNQLDFETERNVFSRILKNDFGAGGSHHHLWMAFYRPAYRRITDLQFIHSLWPDACHVGLHVGDNAPAWLRAVQGRVRREPARFLALLPPLLQIQTSKKEKAVYETPLTAVPDALLEADNLWVGRSFPKEEVLAQGGTLVRRALDTILALWPLYRFYAGR